MTVAYTVVVRYKYRGLFCSQAVAHATQENIQLQTTTVCLQRVGSASDEDAGPGWCTLMSSDYLHAYMCVHSLH